MASELRVDTLKDSSGNNSVGMAYVAGGSAKAWVNFNGTGTIAARDSLNLSSLADDATGVYTINFSNAFDGANYSVSSAGMRNNSYSTNANTIIVGIKSSTDGSTLTASSVSVTTHHHSDATNVDPLTVSVPAHGDLA
tara:strand:+ start:910 stop:1323 length:414 start_codon:yes stop_codon:yes gene_type:complete